MRRRPPRVFLLPGIFGDEPPFASFRGALSGRVTFELLDYPDVDRPSREISDFNGIVRGTVERVHSLQPSGEVHLMGYSFGGQVAFAAACRLQQEGRRVGLLALLDSRALSLKVPGERVRSSDEAMGPALAAADAASRVLVAAGLSEVVRAAIRPAGGLFGAKAADRVRRLLLQNLRGRSLAGLSPGRFDGPLILFRAREQIVPDLPPDLGWGAHCEEVRAVALQGSHNNMFQPDHLAANAELISSQLEERIGR